jgi:hypothetical protein
LVTNGASTGRWAGEGFQPQNLKRPAVVEGYVLTFAPCVELGR